MVANDEKHSPQKKYAILRNIYFALRCYLFGINMLMVKKVVFQTRDDFRFGCSATFLANWWRLVGFLDGNFVADEYLDLRSWYFCIFPFVYNAIFEKKINLWCWKNEFYFENCWTCFRFGIQISSEICEFVAFICLDDLSWTKRLKIWFLLIF